ncbi:MULTISPECIES: hypothetical protein [Cytobacillus]|uniref:hypothetical protein n=1 Tax=Cytobacillus TaxID=2675230 RepID=UPI0020416B94|nr:MULTISPECIES: hypothetical protein [Cytobacillus]MCM3393717.1 hypothetical protein [Cytobacillus oceanisediminis]UQX54097.1 hypothetical protein M5V91_26250 [Cytobacillus pseudoceanisediminis]
MNAIMNAIRNNFNQYKNYYLGALGSIILVAILYLVGDIWIFFKALIVIGLAHILIHLIKERVDVSDPHLVLWIGLISTFIGFTLSTYQAESQQERNDVKRLEGLLTLTENLAVQRRDSAIQELSSHLELYYQEGKHYTGFQTIEIPVDTAYSTIQENGEFIIHLSTNFVANVLTSQNKSLKDGINADGYQSYIEQMKNEKKSPDEKEHLAQVRKYHLFLIQNQYIIERIKLEKRYIEGDFSEGTKEEKEEYDKEVKKLWSEWNEVQKFVENEMSTENYSELSHYKANEPEDFKEFYSLKDFILEEDTYENSINPLNFH